MGNLLEQLGLDGSFFTQLGIFVFTFFLLSRIFFKPFLRLFELRHQRTVEDQAAAKKILAEAQAKIEAYEKNLAEARTKAREEYEEIIKKARAEEAKIYTSARDEVKKINQEVTAQLEKQRASLKKELNGEIEGMAKLISDRLLEGKA